MKSFASTQLFILTDIAKEAILDNLAKRLESLDRVSRNAATQELKAGYEAEKVEVANQFEYYSGTLFTSRKERLEKNYIGSIAREMTPPQFAAAPRNSSCNNCSCSTFEHCKSKPTHTQGGI